MAENKDKLVCGIVMPISAIDGCLESHWSDVLDILTEAIADSGFDANMVSHADDVGFIHKRIVQNLYDNPIVVCDVSGKNPNVMFELGLRLAFDKPTIIVKDDRTKFSFDTAAIEHLEYPRDLRFAQIVEFKQKLSAKIQATYKKATSDSSYTTFLKHFGEFTVAKLDKKEVSGQEYILEELKNLRYLLRKLEHPRHSDYDRYRPPDSIGSDFNACMRDLTKREVDNVMLFVSAHPDVVNVQIEERGADHLHVTGIVKRGVDGREFGRSIRNMIRHGFTAITKTKTKIKSTADARKKTKRITKTS